MRKPRSLPTQERVEELLARGLTLRDAAIRLGYSELGWRKIYPLMQRYGIARPGSRTDVLRRTIDGLTPDQASVVTGALLGDGSIPPLRGRFRNYHLTYSHGERQEDYGRWKMDLLGPFGRQPSEIVIPPYGFKRRDVTTGFRRGFSFATITHPIFAEYRALFYPNGKKIVPADIGERLTPLALAIWYQDDGTYVRWHTGRGGYCQFCSESFDVAGHEILVQALADNYGFAARIKGGRLYLNKPDSLRFADIVRPQCHPSMLYKLPS